MTTAPILLVRPGLPEKATHDRRRNGTTTLFADLAIATGRVADAWRLRRARTDLRERIDAAAS